MSKSYDDSRFGGQKLLVDTPLSGALNGTVGPTVLVKRKMPNPNGLTALQVYFSVGGTAAGTRQLLVGIELGGTGTVSYIGTASLGTAANATTATFPIVGTCSINDNIVISHQGTAADVYNVALQLWGVEAFQNL